MSQRFKVSLLISAVVLMSGCAALSEIATEMPNVDATADVEAVSTLTKDFVNQPWDNILQVGLGYVLALLRIMYKKKKGMK